MKERNVERGTEKEKKAHQLVERDGQERGDKEFTGGGNVDHAPFTHLRTLVS